MKCITGKKCYETKALAEEALIQNRIRHYHNDNSGPVNIYQCHDCGYYHFTSQGEPNPLLIENKHRIDKSREADFWERKLR